MRTALVTSAAICAYGTCSSRAPKGPSRSLMRIFVLVRGVLVVVGDQGALGWGTDLPVEPDRGVERQQALHHPRPQPGGHASAVLLQAELVLQGPDDRLHALAQPVGEAARVVFIPAGRADKAQALLGEELLGLLAGQALVGDDRRPVGRGNPDSSCCDLVKLVDEAAEHITTPDLSRIDLR